MPLGAAPHLVTTRLNLRGPGASDAATIASLADHWDIARRMARLPHPYGIEDADFFLREIVPNEVAWAITLRESGELVGIASLVPHATNGLAELGYWLGRPYWGQGFATEASAAIVSYAFEQLNLPLLASGCFSDNRASQRVLGKIGFKEVSLSRRPCLAVGGNLPFIEMRLDRPDRQTIEPCT